jgi:hypothetical protein
MPATFFLEFWKRFNNILNFYWGMMNFEQVEEVRVQYHGIPKPGVYSEKVWVDLDPAKTKFDFGNLYLAPSLTELELPPPQKYYATGWRKAKIVFGVPLIITMVGM